jgi:hypothetical protein
LLGTSTGKIFAMLRQPNEEEKAKAKAKAKEKEDEKS